MTFPWDPITVAFVALLLAVIALMAGSAWKEGVK